MSHVVVVADKIAVSGLELLEREERLTVVSTVGKPEALQEAMRDATALIVRSATRVTGDLIDAAPKLILIGRAGIGVDNIAVEAATRRGIAVLNAPGANTVSAAEHTMALLLSLFRRIPGAHQSMRSGEWDRQRFAGGEVRGRTLGIVGLGRIGAQVAGLARAFGMRVVAHDPYLSESRARERGITLVPFDRLLSDADVVTLHLPLTDETRHVIDGRRLALMKPSAVIVNAARGGLIDTEALVEALEAGRLAGAALDVFEPEPLPSDSPLRRAPNVILTPHLAASTSEAQDRVALEICSAVRDALLTGSIGSAVNLPGFSGDVLGRLQAVLELGRRMGRLATEILHASVQEIEVTYGGHDDEAPRPVMLATLEGALSAMGIGPVSLVNASFLASDRGISVSRRVGAPAAGFETTVGVTVTGAERSVTVVGASLGEQIGRVVAIDGFVVDIPADGHVMVLRNRDVPGVIGRVGSVLGAAEINVASYHQSRMESPGSGALAAIVVDQAPGAEVLEKLASLPDVIEVRCADLNGKS